MRAPLPPLDELSRKLEAATPLPEASSHEDAPTRSQGLSLAMRLGVELVAGVGVGTGLGYWLDVTIGTIPLFLILGFLLGCAAGFLNMKRATEQLDKQSQSATTPPA